MHPDAFGDIRKQTDQQVNVGADLQQAFGEHLLALVKADRNRSCQHVLDMTAAAKPETAAIEVAAAALCTKGPLKTLCSHGAAEGAHASCQCDMHGLIAAIADAAVCHEQHVVARYMCACFVQNHESESFQVIPRLSICQPLLCRIDSCAQAAFCAGYRGRQACPQYRLTRHGHACCSARARPALGLAWLAVSSNPA